MRSPQRRQLAPGNASVADKPDSLQPCERVGISAISLVHQTLAENVSMSLSIDDPLIWGVLPYKYHWNPNNMRWSLGSYDICFKNKCVQHVRRGFYHFIDLLL